MISFNLFLQNAGTPFWDKFFLLISNFTNEYIYIAMIIFIYYFVDKRNGIKTGFIVIANLMLNFFAKNIFAVPRPYNIDKRIICKDGKQGYGYSMPSGHSQLNAGFFTTIHKLFGGKKYIPLSFIFVILVGFSRLYLGVHAPLDVAAGLILGFVFSLVLCRYIDEIMNNKKYMFFIFAIVGIIDILLFHDKDSIKIFLIYMGFVIGFIIEDRWVNYYNAKKIISKIGECIFCFAGILIIQLLFKFVSQDIRVIKYLFIGLWASLLSPFCIMKLRKAGKK